MNEEIQRRRLARALAIVLAAFVLVGLSGIDWQRVLGLDAGEAPVEESTVDVPQDGEGVLAYAQQLLKEGETALPDAFSLEIGLPPGCRDVRTMGKVVGYAMDCDVAAATKSVEELMVERGWIAMPVEGAAGFVFEKHDGALTWALVSFNQVGSATSVVVRFN